MYLRAVGMPAEGIKAIKDTAFDIASEVKVRLVASVVSDMRQLRN